MVCGIHKRSGQRRREAAAGDPLPVLGTNSSISFYITIISESFLIFSREASITPSHLLLIIFVCYS